MENKLKVRDVIGLYNELNIFLKESFSQSKKYHIEIFVDKLFSFVEPAEKIRKTLISKHGNGFDVPPENINLFWEEYNLVLDEEITIDCTCKEINLELLDSLFSENRYKMIYLYIIKK